MNKLYRDTTSSLHKHLEYINKIWGICVYFIFSWTFVNLKESFTKYGLNANKQPTCTDRLTAILHYVPLQLPSPGVGREESKSKSQLQIISHEHSHKVPGSTGSRNGVEGRGSSFYKIVVRRGIHLWNDKLLCGMRP